MPGSAAWPRRLLGASIVVGLALSVRTVAASPDLARPDRLIPDLLVGWLFIGSGAAIRLRRATGPVSALMIVSGLAWSAGGVFHRGPLVHLLLSFPTGRLVGRLATVVVAFAWIDGVVGSFIRLDDATLVIAGALVVAAVTRVMQSSGPVRRGRAGPTLASLAVAVALVSGRLPVIAGFDPTASQLPLYEAVLAATAVGLGADLLWGGWSRVAVTGLVVELGDRADAGSLRDRLARALGDPSLVVGYAIEGTDGYVDAAADPIRLPEAASGRVITPVMQAGEPLAVLIHDAAVLGDPVLIESVAAAAGLAVSNVRLQAEIQERVSELEASQRRIVSAADEERLRLEQALTNGAGAHMARVGDLLERLESSTDPALRNDVAAVLDELHGSSAELQRFARGVYPAGLAESGLAAALGELAARCPTPVTLTIAAASLPTLLEATVWFVCSEALANVAKHAMATRAEIHVTVGRDRLELTVADDGIGGADETGSGLRGLAHRVEALGGRLRVVSPPDRGTRLEVELPIR